jgi:hypothetical protein
MVASIALTGAISGFSDDWFPVAQPLLSYETDSKFLGGPLTFAYLAPIDDISPINFTLNAVAPISTDGNAATPLGALFLLNLQDNTNPTQPQPFPSTQYALFSWGTVVTSNPQGVSLQLAIFVGEESQPDWICSPYVALSLCAPAKLSCRHRVAKYAIDSLLTVCPL